MSACLRDITLCGELEILHENQIEERGKKEVLTLMTTVTSFVRPFVVTKLKMNITKQ